MLRNMFTAVLKQEITPMPHSEDVRLCWHMVTMCCYMVIFPSAQISLANILASLCKVIPGRKKIQNSFPMKSVYDTKQFFFPLEFQLFAWLQGDRVLRGIRKKNKKNCFFNTSCKFTCLLNADTFSFKSLHPLTSLQSLHVPAAVSQQ